MIWRSDLYGLASDGFWFTTFNTTYCTSAVREICLCFACTALSGLERAKGASEAKCGLYSLQCMANTHTTQLNYNSKRLKFKLLLNLTCVSHSQIAEQAKEKTQLQCFGNILGVPWPYHKSENQITFFFFLISATAITAQDATHKIRVYDANHKQINI